MFRIYADKTQLTVKTREPVTSGSANVYRVQFEFSPDWTGLAKTVYFRSGSQTVPLLLPEDGECIIPWEVTDPDDTGKMLFVGICGTCNGRVILPTIETSLGIILKGVTNWGSSQVPTPGLYEQILAVLMQKQEKIAGLPGQIVGFDESGNPVAQDMPSAGGDGGTADHRKLSNRDAADQHPIDAITGLEEALQQIPIPMTAEELQNILNGGNKHVQDT